MSQLIVSIHTPHVILDASGSHQILGYCLDDLLGRGFDVFGGPETDGAMIEKAIEYSAVCSATVQFQVILYETSGRSRLMEAACSPAEHHGKACCRISLTFSSCASLSSVLQDTASSWALVTAQPPYNIEAVSEGFEAAFRLSAANLLGRSLDKALSRFAPPRRLRALLRSASEGRRSHDSYSGAAAAACACGACSDAAGEVSCVPVVAAPNGGIAHVLVVDIAIEEVPTVPTHGRHLRCGQLRLRRHLC